MSDTEFKINPKHNYYAVSVARPGSQLFVVRLEWEADNDSSQEETEDIETNFSLTMVRFSGMQYVLVGLERPAHSKVVEIAHELNLKVVQGYPISCSTTSMSNNSQTEHFPIQCAADSIYTIEGQIDVDDPKDLLKMKRAEIRQVQEYLEKKYKQLDDEDENFDDIELVDEPIDR